MPTDYFNFAPFQRKPYTPDLNSLRQLYMREMGSNAVPPKDEELVQWWKAVEGGGAGASSPDSAEPPSPAPAWPSNLDNNSTMASLLKNSAFNRPGNIGGGDSFGRVSGGGGGPEGMVQQAIMQHLRYMLQPDVSAAPMGEVDAASAGITEYPDLKYDTALSNPRAMEAVGPLMDLFGGLEKQKLSQRIGEQTLQDMESRRGYTDAQAEALRLNPSKVRPGAAMDAAKALDRTNRWLMAFEQKIAQAAGGIVIDPKMGELPAEQATALSAQIKQNVQQAQDFLQKAIEYERQGDPASGAYYAQQAVALLSKYGTLMDEDTGLGTPAPAGPPATTGAAFVAGIPRR
jgi:hypothetical protein